MLDPSPHPDLVWLAPSGAQHLVEAVRERVIRAASYRPFEGGRRVFVVEAAEAMRDESQNALLKTLEEPPGFAHLILLSSEPEALLETISSRCQPVEFAPLPAAAVEAALGRAIPTRSPPRPASRPGTSTAPASCSPTGGASCAPRAASSSRSRAPGAPWRKLLTPPRRSALTPRPRPVRRWRRRRRPGSSARPARSPTRRSGPGAAAAPRCSTSASALCAGWCRDLAAVAAGAEDVVFNRDRLAQLRAGAEGLDPAAGRRAAELVQDTRRRLDLNVSEELALEALCFRLEDELEA